MLPDSPAMTRCLMAVITQLERDLASWGPVEFCPGGIPPTTTQSNGQWPRRYVFSPPTLSWVGACNAYPTVRLDISAYEIYARVGLDGPYQDIIVIVERDPNDVVDLVPQVGAAAMTKLVKRIGVLLKRRARKQRKRASRATRAQGRKRQTP